MYKQKAKNDNDKFMRLFNSSRIFCRLCALTFYSLQMYLPVDQILN